MNAYISVLLLLLIHIAICEQTIENCECEGDCQSFVDGRKKMDTCPVSKECKGAYWDILRLQWRDCCKYGSQDSQEKQKRENKLRFLLTEIYNNNNKSFFPPMIGIMNQSVITTFQNQRDENPLGRTKQIHSVGWHGSFQFTPQEHNGPKQTGIFSDESIGVVRFSLMSQFEKNLIKPAVALKFLRSQINSCNILAMPSLDGQQSLNFFEKEFKNHVSPSKNFRIQSIFKKFRQASNCNYCLGLKSCSEYDSNGEHILEPKFPFMLSLYPLITFDEHNVESVEDIDFQFINIQGDTPLFEVRAYESPDDVLHRIQNAIGYIKSLTPISTSLQGDSILSFRHQQFENDLQSNIDWVAAINQNPALFCGHECAAKLIESKCQ